ncbi:hypothetical protein ACU10_08220 [Xanthomonas oryzae pv. oryzicola]|nr:hypothetical protein ACU13_08275 [Xanthomonas oryzae pv. oryzicola]AKN96759.1 hypothetical protein ACU10_08220 [Xanthomonas oryzae pv. oryzicola]AKO11983.1 hypothetical protein ACU14_08230 [Xanthomonas oryzae pv. oryzicola]AKO15721.1 hypothetical protein ACU12_08255 [Xanthomonas oryzae pv. oryzicola]
MLKDLASNFVALRYPYEKYGHMTQSEYERVASDWIASGAEVASADYRYHPEELFALTFALQQHLRWFASTARSLIHPLGNL